MIATSRRQIGDKQILARKTAKLMHYPHLRNDDPSTAWLTAFTAQEKRNGHRIIGHGGDTELFHSDLHLISDSKWFLRLPINSAGKGEVSSRTSCLRNSSIAYHTLRPRGKVGCFPSDAPLFAGLYKASRPALTPHCSFAHGSSANQGFPNATGP